MYTIDGNPAKELDVIKLCKTLSIHMENLCQFLPQDRVSEFADMTPQQILKATEEAIGGQVGDGVTV
jgi:chromosome segregation ATPase